MKYSLLLLLLFPVLLLGQTSETYNRGVISQWLQDASWEEIIAVAQSNKNPDTFLLQSAGYASYQAGDKNAAAEYFGRALMLDSTNRQGLYYSSAMLRADEQYRQAIPLLERLCKVAPNVAAYHVMLADCYTAQELKPQSVYQLQIARKLAPASASIANLLANAWIRTKTWDSATAILNEALKLHPRDAPLISTAINLAYSRKQFQRASTLCDSLLLTGKPRYEALLAGIYADMELKNFRHAIRLGSVLMALGSETEEVLYYSALAHQGLGNWRAADTLLRKCISKVMKPNLNAYYIAMGECAAKQKQWVRSAACYDTAYYLFHQPLTLYRKGLSFESAGRKPEATAAFKRYLALPERSQDTAIAGYLKRRIQ